MERYKSAQSKVLSANKKLKQLQNKGIELNKTLTKLNKGIVVKQQTKSIEKESNNFPNFKIQKISPKTLVKLYLILVVIYVLLEMAFQPL